MILTLFHLCYNLLSAQLEDVYKSFINIIIIEAANIKHSLLALAMKTHCSSLCPAFSYTFAVFRLTFPDEPPKFD